MDIKISCHACGQHVVVDSSEGGSNVNCPNCNTELTIPEIVVGEPTSELPKIDNESQATAGVQPVYVYSPPQKQRSIGWGVFWGLVGFFIILPIAVFAALLFLGVLGTTALEASKERAKLHSVSSNTVNPSATASTPVNGSKPKPLSQLKLGKEFKISKDEIRNLTFIQRADSPGLETGCYLYIADDGDLDPTLFMRCQYYAKDSFHFDSLMFRAGNTTYQVKNERFERMDSKRVNGNFFGYNDFLVSSGKNHQALKALLNSSDVKALRYDSEVYNTYIDFKFLPSDLAAMKSVFRVWQELKGS